MCKILKILLQYYPGLAEKYIEMIFLNLDIWVNAKSEVQDTIISTLTDSIQNMCKVLKIDKIIDFLLNCIEICVNKRKDLNKFIQQFSEIVIKLAQENLNDVIISKIISYANVFYMRRLPNYPLQLFYVLKILLELFLTCKERLFKEIRESMKRKKENKVLNTLFVIMDYILYFKENSRATKYPGVTLCMSPREKETTKIEEKEDPICIFIKSKDGSLIIDSIQAMTIYMLLSFDWASMQDILKDFPKEDLYTIPANIPTENSPTNVERRNIDAVGFFLKSLEKKISENASNIYLNKLFRAFITFIHFLWRTRKKR